MMEETHEKNKITEKTRNKAETLQFEKILSKFYIERTKHDLQLQDPEIDTADQHERISLLLLITASLLAINAAILSTMMLSKISLTSIERNHYYELTSPKIEYTGYALSK